MKFLKKLEFGIRQSVELYIPAISFVVMFCLFCYQILVRYVISKFTNLVVPWTTEVEQSCFLWIALLGACYVQRNKGHVVFTMVYDAEVRAGVDLAQARVEVSGNAITVSLPAPQLLGIEIDPNSLEFYDSSFALFNWENKQDTAEALKVAQQDAEGKVNQANMLEQAKAQAHTLVENLLKPFTVGDNAYTVTVVDQ